MKVRFGKRQLCHLQRTCRFGGPSFLALLGFACFVGMAWRFGLDVEYRFEVAIITITWISLLATGLMLAFFFRSAERQGLNPPQ